MFFLNQIKNIFRSLNKIKIFKNKIKMSNTRQAILSVDKASDSLPQEGPRQILTPRRVEEREENKKLAQLKRLKEYAKAVNEGRINENSPDSEKDLDLTDFTLEYLPEELEYVPGHMKIFPCPVKKLPSKFRGTGGCLMISKELEVLPPITVGESLFFPPECELRYIPAGVRVESYTDAAFTCLTDVSLDAYFGAEGLNVCFTPVEVRLKFDQDFYAEKHASPQKIAMSDKDPLEYLETDRAGIQKYLDKWNAMDLKK